MRKIFAVLLALSPVLAFSSPLPDELSICYKVKNDKVINKGTCIISSGNFAGGNYIDIQYKGKEYSYTGDSKGYRRDSYFQKIPKSEPLLSTGDNEIICFKDKTYDICYKE